MNEKTCPSCALMGKTSYLHQYQVNPNEAVVLCTEERCGYPFMSTRDIMVNRRKYEDADIPVSNVDNFFAMCKAANQERKEKQHTSRMMSGHYFPQQPETSGHYNMTPENHYASMSGDLPHAPPVSIQVLPAVPSEAAAEFQSCNLVNHVQNQHEAQSMPYPMGITGGKRSVFSLPDNQENIIIDGAGCSGGNVTLAREHFQPGIPQSSGDHNMITNPYPQDNQPPVIKRGRGRPRGSLNKVKREKGSVPAERVRVTHCQTAPGDGSMKRKRGRPRGSRSFSSSRGGHNVTTGKYCNAGGTSNPNHSSIGYGVSSNSTAEPSYMQYMAGGYMQTPHSPYRAVVKEEDSEEYRAESYYNPGMKVVPELNSGAATWTGQPQNFSDTLRPGNVFTNNTPNPADDFNVNCSMTGLAIPLGESTPAYNDLEPNMHQAQDIPVVSQMFTKMHDMVDISKFNASNAIPN